MRNAQFSLDFVAPDLSQMTDRPTLARKDIRAFDADVQDMLLMLVNKFGIKYRFTSAALLIYPPDVSKDPFKISPQRSGKTQLRYLERFAHENLSVEAKETAGLQVRDKEIVHLAEKLNGVEHPVDGIWEPVIGLGETKYTGFEVNQDGLFRCIRCREKGLIVTNESRRFFGGHNRYHHTDKGKPMPNMGGEVKEKLDKLIDLGTKESLSDLQKRFPPAEEVAVMTDEHGVPREVVLGRALDDLPVMQERPIQQAIDLLLCATGRGEGYEVKLRERIVLLEEQCRLAIQRAEDAETKLELIQEHIREALTI